MYVTDQPIPLASLLAQQPDANCGAMASFVGMVRNHHQNRQVEKLYYECYANMANKQIGRIIERIKTDTGVHKIQVMHRVGWIEIQDAAIVIVVFAAHRDEAFCACRAVIDTIKQEVPIWKHEFFKDGTSQWVGQADAKSSKPTENHMPT